MKCPPDSPPPASTYLPGTTTLPDIQLSWMPSSANMLSPEKSLLQPPELPIYKVRPFLTSGFIYFIHAKTRAAASLHLPGCHVEAANGTPHQNDAYCRKTRPVDDAPNASVYSRGTLPLLPVEKGAVEQARWESTWELAKAGLIEEIAPDIRIRQYSTLLRIGKDYMAPVARLPAPCGTWIFGDSGSGKTRAVLDQYPDSYPKPRYEII